jgi:poly-gamma-glutamate capsule biosynthesis protein CapA/YwtB (metallophosphatase superfamily)
MIVSPKNFFVPSGKRNQPIQDSTISIKFIAVGDLMCHSPEFQYARVTADSFDFRPFFKFVKPVLGEADICFGNLETVLAGADEQYSGYPYFNSPDGFLGAIKDAGFTHLTTANNHCLDRGEKGILRTIEQLQKAGIPYVGTAVSGSDKDSIRIFKKNGITFSLLAYSYSTNGNPIPKGKDYLVSLIDTAKIVENVINAKSKSDIVIVSFHFGEEYRQRQSKWQEMVVEKAIQAGADIIIGSHPHVLQPGNYFHSDKSSLDSGLVVYSLGNFIANQQERYKDAGSIFRFSIVKNLKTQKFTLKEVGFIPTWVFKGTDKEKKVFYVIPESDSASYASMPFLNYFVKKRMFQAFDDTKKTLKSFSAFRKNP